MIAELPKSMMIKTSRTSLKKERFDTRKLRLYINRLRFMRHFIYSTSSFNVTTVVYALITGMLGAFKIDVYGS